VTVSFSAQPDQLRQVLSHMFSQVFEVLVTSLWRTQFFDPGWDLFKCRVIGPEEGDELECLVELDLKRATHDMGLVGFGPTSHGEDHPESCWPVLG